MIVPTEYEEHVAFVRYLELKGYDYWHTPNQTYTKSWNQKRINKALGVKPGIPDLFVIVGYQVIGVEMKRTKGGTVSASQKDWMKKLAAAGIPTKVCKGADEAISFVETFKPRKAYA